MITIKYAFLSVIMDQPTIPARSPRTLSDVPLALVRAGGRARRRPCCSKRPGVIPAADIVGCMDLDLATDLEHIPEVLAAFEQGADVVYGTRLHKKATVVGRTLRREAVSRTFNFIVRHYLGVTISDAMCGFEFLRRPLYPKLAAAGAASDGWFFSAEVLVVAQWQGMTVVELPVHWTDSPTSKVRISSLSLEYLKAMRILRARRSPGRVK